MKCYIYLKLCSGVLFRNDTKHRAKMMQNCQDHKTSLLPLCHCVVEVHKTHYSTMRFNTYCLVSVLLVAPHHQCLVNGAARGAGGNTDTRNLLGNDSGRRQLMEDKDNTGQGGGDALEAPGPCLPANEVPDYILNHERTIASGCGTTNTCPGGCCRLFSWSECDEDNSFPILQCICNANTGTNPPVFQPTPPPTPIPPTPPPTPNPTISPPPTPFPTKSPSVSPTPEPTAPGTQSPTISPRPTDPPTPNPTSPPTTSEPSSSPSTSEPSSSPSSSPSGEPSLSPTPRPTDSPSASPSSTPSETPSASPTTSFPSFAPSESPSETPTETPFSTEDTTYQGSPVRQSQCLLPPPEPRFVKTNIFTYTYEVYVTGGATTANTATAQQTIVDNNLNDPIHDAVARKFLKCMYEDDEADLWIIQSAPQDVDETMTCRGSVLSSDSCFVVVAVESIYVYDVPPNRKQRTIRKLQESAAVEEFRSEINSFINNEMTAGTFNYSPQINVAYVNDGSNPVVTQAPTPSPVPPPTDSPVQSPVDPPVGGLGDGGTDSLTAAQGAGQPEEEEEGWPVAGIAALAVGCAVLMVFILLAISRSRSKRRERQLVYLDKADLEIMNQTMEDHLELDSNDQEGYDMDGMGVVRSSPESYQMEEDEFTSSSPQSGSPSRRSQRGPLHSQDELDKVVGNHRGQNTPQRSKRGRVYLSKDTVDL